MPYPAQTSRDQVIATAHQLIEVHGYEAVSLARLAQALGIKAPSLYKHVEDKNALIQAVNTLTYQHLVAAMIAPQEHDPIQRAFAMARAYREFAATHPVTYALAFTTVSPATQPAPSVLESLVQPLQAVFAQIVGEDHAVDALRGAWALLHGFIVLQANQQFQRPFAIDTSFDTALAAYLRGWQASP
jgi:AcrR family transcriptional regulator